MKLQKIVAVTILIGVYALLFWGLPVWVESQTIMGWQIETYSDKIVFTHIIVGMCLVIAGLCRLAIEILIDS